MCNVPYLGKRLVHVLKDSPPAISVKQDVMEHGVTFSYSREAGPSVSLPDGTIVYLDDSQYVPYLNGHCKTENAWRPRKGTETSKIQSAADFMCSPCGPAPWSGAAASIATTTAPPKAAKTNGPDLEPWSERIKPTTPTPSRSISARERRESCPERQKHSTTPNLLLPEDTAVGSGHRSAAIGVNVKSQQTSGNALTMKSYISLITGPFFIEVFSGSGRLADVVRQSGVQAFEYDLTDKGGRRNLLHANVLKELRELIAHPMCRGVWFGYPCGTFSSARRHDGGPPPLRGTNSKDIWGLPELQGKERARVNSANKLLLRMNELMKHCESNSVPFYLENPQTSKLWMHPLIRK